MSSCSFSPLVNDFKAGGAGYFLILEPATLLDLFRAALGVRSNASSSVSPVVSAFSDGAEAEVVEVEDDRAR